jgi:hypothetical protein
MARSLLLPALTCAILVLAGGCHQWFIDRADREVSQLIESRQQAALGETHPADVGRETGRISTTDSMYSFTPHPVDPEVPEGFRSATTPRPESAGTTTAPIDALATQPAADVAPLEFTLADCLGYAQRNAREYQTAKEDLYLSALALSLERFLWTPQFSGQTSFEFADYGQVRDFDRAMTAIASLAVEQRLPLGGAVTAQLIDTWMRDLKVHTTSGETGQMILAADIPLLRGAGRVAYESRYQAERDLIYGVRGFERFRRGFLVDIAADFYRLLALQSEIENAELQVASLAEEQRRTEALADKEQILQFEYDRTRVELLNARNRLQAAKERYGTALDQFRIRLNMGTVTPLELIDEGADIWEPEVEEDEAVATALRYRLDLLNALDTVDDARRGVRIARNNLLPDFDFSGSVTMDTDPNKPSTVDYNTERTTWRGMLELEIPLNRQAERNTFRSSLIDLRRAERAYEEFRDQVAAEVRRAIRQIELARFSLVIQQESIAVNEFRKAQVDEFSRLGRLTSTRDKIEAENDLRNARNALASASSDYRRTILEFLLAAGALRVEDDGRWRSFTPGPAPPTTQPTTEPAAEANSG